MKNLAHSASPNHIGRMHYQSLGSNIERQCQLLSERAPVDPNPLNRSSGIVTKLRPVGSAVLCVSVLRLLDR
jgi:hypothetical protein